MFKPISDKMVCKQSTVYVVIVIILGAFIQSGHTFLEREIVRLTLLIISLFTITHIILLVYIT